MTQFSGNSKTTIILHYTPVDGSPDAESKTLQ